MTPDFSPKMLKLFLRGRVAFIALTETMPEPQAHRAMVRRVAKVAKVKQAQVRRAYSGTLTCKAARLAIWHALGVYPSFSKVILTANGGQEHVPELAVGAAR